MVGQGFMYSIWIERKRNANDETVSQSANEGISDDKSKGIAEWAGKARADFDKLTDAHESEIVEYLENDKITAYNDFKLVLNGRMGYKNLTLTNL
jgi:hypothetical protein